MRGSERISESSSPAVRREETSLFNSFYKVIYVVKIFLPGFKKKYAAVLQSSSYYTFTPSCPDPAVSMPRVLNSESH